MKRNSINPIIAWFVGRYQKIRSSRMRVSFKADGLGVRGKDLSFLDEQRFASAWESAKELNKEGWSKRKRGVPDIRWRAHVCCWAARNALHLPGDFVECGVHTGLLSLTVADYVKLNNTDRKFWLFDTYEGIPTESLVGVERELAGKKNVNIYFDVYEIAKKNFARFSGARLVKGVIPNSFEDCELDRISYLSMDLNNAPAERAAIEYLWPKLVPGAIVVIDDYAFSGHAKQYEMWNEFAESVGQIVLTLPTGQGLIIRTS